MKNALDEKTPELRRITALATLAVAALAGCSPDGPPVQPSARAEAAHALASPLTAAHGRAMPAELRAAYIASVQAGASEAYHVRQAGSGAVRALNRVQGLSAELDPAGVHLASVDATFPWRVSMALSASGCEGDLAAVAKAEPSASGNRIEYRRGGIVEWYLNGPLGLEQGFTLPQPPPCRSHGGGPVTLVMALGGDLSAKLSAGGDAVELSDRSGAVRLRYSDLHVHDATGRTLPGRLSAGAERLSIHVEDAGAVYPVVVDPLIGLQQTKLFASDAVASDELGTDVAIDADTAVVVARGDSLSSGEAYVFVRSGNVWTEQAVLQTSSGSFVELGCSVALSGDTALLGVSLDDTVATQAGAAYVFVRSGTTWTEQGKLLPSTTDPAAQYDHFGSAVALAGDTAVIGAPGDEDSGQERGAAYVFTRSGTMWTQQAKLVASDGALEDQFGAGVTLQGDTAVVGAAARDGIATDAGGGYVFVRNGGSWTEQTRLNASDGAAADYFGIHLALSADTLLVGVGNSDGAGADSGAAYVFVRSGTTWTEQAKLTAGDGAADDLFGQSVALSGDRAVIGAPRADGGGLADSGSAYLFVRNGTTWVQESKLTTSDAALGDGFGASVALEGNTVLAGAFGDDDNGNDSGSLYVFTLALSNGDGCTSATECGSGQCVDGVCCDAACGGGDMTDCEACSVAAGAAADGTCGPVAMGRTCRPAIGSCDLAEVCSGSSTACPPDAVAPSDAECRGAGGVCDVAETCDGTTKMCPANVVVPAGTECRPATGPCDTAEACDGSDLGCPADGFVAAGTECRAAVGTCDIAELCDGNGAGCPSDLQADRGTPCPGGTCVLGQCSPTPKPQEEGGCGCRLARERSEPGQDQAPSVPFLLALGALIAIERRRRG